MKFPKKLIPEILFENKNLLVINKPAGLVVHSDGKTVEPNLCDWIIEKYPKIEKVGEPSKAPDGTLLYRPGIVHRLDRETSGVMIIAKTQPAFEYLKQQFQDRLVHKTYNTFVWGHVKTEKGTIDKPIGRSTSDFRKWSAGRFARGEMREAVTVYKTLGRYKFDYLDQAKATGKGNKTVDDFKMAPLFSFVEAKPETGRTHQIRVHMHYLNHPIVGDFLYAPHHPQALGFGRTALHARAIEFTDLGGGLIKIEAPLPADFEKALKLVKKFQV